jgi:carbonic anhydrase
MKIAFYTLLLSGLLSTACSMKSRRTEDLPPTPVAAAESKPAQDEVKAPLTPPPVATHAASAKKTGVDPSTALGWLKNGNLRYRKSHLRKDGQTVSDMKRLASKQAPHSIILSCSDSRVPPELVFDQKLGEIFVIRNAGEIPDKASIASIEYALEHLGSRLLVVMGHTSCGAVKAALATIDGQDAGSPALNALVQDIHPRLASFKGQAPGKDVLEESWTNAQGIAQDLVARSEIIRNHVASGNLVIKSALYHLDNGQVDFDAPQKEK